MNPIKEEPLQEPETQHKNQTLLHIYFPLLCVVIICLVGFFFIILVNSGQPQTTASWANISVMFLILPVALMGLVSLILLIVFIKFSTQWNKSLPVSLKNVRIKAIQINQKIQAVSQKPTKPIIGLQAVYAGFKSLFRK